MTIPALIRENPFNAPPTAIPANAPLTRFVLSRNSTRACVASNIPFIVSREIKFEDRPSNAACKDLVFASIELRYPSSNLAIAVPLDDSAICSYCNALS